jgi:hypothetical protein
MHALNPTSEQFAQFYRPLVGDDVAVSTFRTELTGMLDGAASPPAAYAQLRNGAKLIVQQTVDACRDDQAGLLERMRWNRLGSNGNLGITLSVAAAQAVGDITSAAADVPQYDTTVRRNMNHVLGHVFGMALTGKFVGALNIEALEQGLNPRSPLQLLHLLARFMVNDSFGSHLSNGFVRHVSQETGQVDIRPRYPHRMGKIFDRQCPATVTRTESKKSALYVFMHAIGDVAMNEIYPMQFDIMPTPQA